MNKIFTLAFISSLFFGCSDIYVNDIDVDYTTSTIIPGQSIIELPDGIPAEELPPVSLTDIGFNEFTQFDINASQTFKERVGSVSKVTFINLETFKLSTVDTNQSLDFLDSVKFYIAIGDNAEELLAYADSFAIGVNQLYLDVSKQLDLTPYIQSDDITIRAEFLGNLPAEETEIKADLLFLVDTTHSSIIN